MAILIQTKQILKASFKIIKANSKLLNYIPKQSSRRINEKQQNTTLSNLKFKMSVTQSKLAGMQKTG